MFPPFDGSPMRENFLRGGRNRQGVGIPRAPWPTVLSEPPTFICQFQFPSPHCMPQHGMESKRLSPEGRNRKTQIHVFQIRVATISCTCSSDGSVSRMQSRRREGKPCFKISLHTRHVCMVVSPRITTLHWISLF